ncbi:MAG: TIGR03067 domain-containing protein [Planctomycetes bacterium]|nr:TIGR03067 domain-containing protein [Planctomycetota bacterium]
MRAALALCLLLGSGAPAQEPKKPDPKAEMKKLEGVWEGFVVEGKGERADRGPYQLRITVTGDKMTAVDLKNNKDMGSGTFKIDPTKSLKTLDATGVVPPAKRDKTYLGVYELDGDTLKWCVDNRQRGERPTEFRSNNGNFLMILKRKK